LSWPARAPPEILENVPRLVSAYYTHRPDPAQADQRVAFGTSGHRGSSALGSFNEAHILAVCQAICEHRVREGITGPLYVGMDTHALSEPALATSVERRQRGRAFCRPARATRRRRPSARHLDL
jgi:phosphoglucomutase